MVAEAGKVDLEFRAYRKPDQTRNLPETPKPSGRGLHSKPYVCTTRLPFVRARYHYQPPKDQDKGCNAKSCFLVKILGCRYNSTAFAKYMMPVGMLKACWERS